MVTRRSVLRAIAAAPAAAAVTAIAGCSRAVDPEASSRTSLDALRIQYQPGVSASIRSQVPTLVDAALARVRSVWVAPLAAAGRSPAMPRSIDVTSTRAQFIAEGGGSGQGVAATTLADGTVVLSPDVWTGTSREGQVVVIAHELTHVVLHSQTSTSARWLVEGPPEWTAYHGTGLSLPVIAPRLAAAVRAGRPAAGPPADAAFSDGPLQAAYQSAFTWCTFLVQRSTTEAFTGFVLAATDQPAARLQAIFEAHYNVSIASLSDDYQKFQRTTFGAVRPSA